MTRFKRNLVLFGAGGTLLAGAAFAAAAIAWRLREQRTTYFTGADIIQRPVEAGDPRDVLWRSPVDVAGGVNTYADEYQPAVTADGMTLLFARGQVGHDADIYFSTREPDGWSEPRPLASVNTEADELGPVIGLADGALYFSSNRADGVGSYDLWVAHPTETGWGPARNLGPQVNSRYNEFRPALTPDGALLYFSSNRPRPGADDAPGPDAWMSQIADDMEHRDYDLYAAEHNDGTPGPAAAVAALNTPANEIAPAITPVGDFLYFSSDRPGGRGGFDLYRSRRLDGRHLEPANLGDPVNTAANELDPAVSLDGFALHFGSDRLRPSAVADYDLFYTTSREVFLQTETYRASIDWPTIWAGLWPSVLTILVGLLLIALLALFMRRLEYRKLSLLVKCLAVSLLVHLLLLVGLAFWGVSVSLSQGLTKARGLRVALVSPSVDQGIAQQVRGQLTNVTLAPARPGADQSPFSPLELDALAAADLDVDRSTIESQPVVTPPDEATPTPADLPTPPREPLTEQVALEVELPRPSAPARRAEKTMSVAAERSSGEPPAALPMPLQRSPQAVAVQPADSPAATATETLAVDTPAGATPPMPEPSASAAARRVEAQRSMNLPAPQSPDPAMERQSAEAQARSAPIGVVPRIQTSPPVADPPALEALVRLPPRQADARPAETTFAPAAPTAADAAVPASLAVFRSTPATPPTGATALAVELPRAPEGPHPKTAGEAAPRLVAAAGGAPRYESVSAWQPDSGREASVRIAPAAGVSQGAQTTLVPSTSDEAPSAPPPWRQASGVKAAPTHDVTLPAPPIRQSVAAGEPSLESPRVAEADEPAAIGTAGVVDPAGDDRVAVAPESSPLADEPDILADRSAHDADAPQSDHPGHVNVAARIGKVALALDVPSAERPVQADAGAQESVEVEAARWGTDRTAARAVVTPAAPRAGRVDLGPTPLGAAAPPLLLAAGPADSTPRTVRADAGRRSEGLVIPPMDQVALPPLEAGVTATGFDSAIALALATRKASRASWRAAPSGRDRRKAGKPVVIPPEQVPLEIAIDPPDRVLGDLVPDHRSKRHEPAPAIVLATREFSPAAADLELRVPTQITFAPNPYPHRSEHRRDEVVKRMGGSEKTEHAVAIALDWLQRHQSADGRWDGTRYDSECGSCWGPQRVKSNVALTGLATLCFLAADHTHVKAGPYKDTVDRALTWLLDQQRHNGSLMGPESLYSHGIATIALAEAYGMTGDLRLAEPVKAAVDFIYAARSQGLGGWRYSPGQFGDTSVLGWQVMALTSAKGAKVEVPEEAFEVARKWLDMVSRSSPPGLYPYQPFREVTPAMTAEGMLVQQLLGADRTEVRMEASAQYILAHPPRWKPDGNTYYWYYATLALFQHQGTAWEQWNEAVKEQLVSHQKTSGKVAGSWDPDDRWALVGGRVYQTAMCTLTLEVYYRYLPSFVSDE